MELVLTKNDQNQVTVTCDGQLSRTFSLTDLLPERQDDPLALTNPVQTGARLFAALFADGSPALAAWAKHPKRILLVAEDPALDTIPWEYLHGPDGFVVLDAAFLRGLPVAKRQPAPDLTGIPLHIVAIPSNPIDHDIARLDIAGEWTRLKDSINGLETAIRLERARPPTLEQARRLVANQRHRVVHFMGHGDHNGKDSFVFFENEYGAPKAVTAKEFINRFEDSAFLVTLNSCKGALAGETEFSNMAHALVQRGIPYALGMGSNVQDDDAKTFSSTFYSELARGSSVENALRQARNSLSDSKNPWAVGTPVLYTSLNEAAKGFETPPGAPRIDEHQPPLEVGVLPRAEGAFQGRVDELLALGGALTGEPRAKLLTIHGPGGQGKTALAREAAERFAHAWPGGVWAISLEDFHVLDRFTLELTRLFKIDLDGIHKQVAASYPNLEITDHQQRVQGELERRILAVLNNQRALLVLDNAETFVEAVDAKDKAALDLAAFLKEKVLSTQASLLLTSRNHLGWTGEQALELAGLSDEEGARLFWQSAPGRSLDAIGPLAQDISHKVAGHPLSLRLLGGAFDASQISLDEFVHQVEDTLLQAEDKYKHEDHRHRTLYASIETSVRYLDENERALLSGLWIFKSPFQPETAGQVFAPPNLPEAETQQEQIAERLYTLFQRGLLVREVEALSDGNLLLYRSLPIVRLFARHYLEQTQSVKALQAQMGKAYAALLRNIRDEIDHSSWASTLAKRCREDLEACASCVESGEQSRYANRLGFVLQWIGDRQAGLRWLEQGLAIAQGTDPELESQILNNMALVHNAIGNPGKALELYEQMLPIVRAMGDRASEIANLSNMALVYHATGEPDKALELFEQALLIDRALGDRADEAAILTNMGDVYRAMGKPDKALELFEQALPMHREIGDRAKEAISLNNMAVVYLTTGHPGKALELFEQALLLRRAVGDQAGEAKTLNNMGTVYHETGNQGKALELYEKVLPIRRAVGDRAGEATTLSNMGEVYHVMGELDKALELFEQALSLKRAVGDRAGEAITLNNMANVYSSDTDQLGKALELYEQALFLGRAVGDQAGEAATFFGMALLMRDMVHEGQAVEFLRQAVLLEKQVQHPDYQQNREKLAQWEDAIACGKSLRGPSPGEVQIITNKTLAVLTNVPDGRSEWREDIAGLLQKVQTEKQQAETEFLIALLVLLDGKTPTLSATNPYAGVVQGILQNLPGGKAGLE
jgi:tetratricopeptide (TPR) repeat protein